MTTHGYLDAARNGFISGWVMRADKPFEALSLRIRANEALLAEVVADAYRNDVAAAEIGTGRYGFTLAGPSASLPDGGCLVTIEDRASGEVVLSMHVAPAGITAAAPDVNAHGYIDSVTYNRLAGWVWYPGRPLETVRIRVLADGKVIAHAAANRLRPDVEAAGIGTGRYGFDLTSEFKPPLAGCLIAVEDDATGLALTNSPMRLEPPLQLDGPVSTAITALFDSPGSDDDLQARAEFAGRQAERLLQRLTDRRSQRTARAAQRTRKWRWRPEDGPEPTYVPMRALVLDNTMPSPGHDAGSHALLSHMASLRRIGFDVLFAPADMRGGPGACTLDAMGIGTVTEPWCSSVEELMCRECSEFDLVYIHKYEPAARYVAMARHYMPRARRIYSVADLHGLRLTRQGEIEERPELVAHAKVVHQLEVTAAAGCHAVVTHSPVEAAILRKALPAGRVEVVPWHVPVNATRQTFAERAGIAFIGTYSHPPNLDAALFLQHEVLPLVWEAEPGIVCTLAGTHMPRSLAEPRDGRIRAVGHVDSLSDLLGEVRLTVAPLAYGAGLKGKVADSMAMGVPCVCSPVAAEGFELPPPLHGLIAPDAASLAASIIRVHRDAALFEACRQAGLAYVSGAFSEAVVDAGLRRAAGLPHAAGTLPG